MNLKRLAEIHKRVVDEDLFTGTDSCAMLAALERVWDAEKFRDELAKKWPGRTIKVIEEQWFGLGGDWDIWSALIFSENGSFVQSNNSARTLPELRDKVAAAMGECR